MKFYKVFRIGIILIIYSTTIFSQTGSSVTFFPEGRHFMPLRANIYEPKIGVLYFTENQNLKVDIGYSTDVLEWRINSQYRVTAGIDFFAYALSTSFKGKRLQIDAIDGFFGGDITVSNSGKESQYFLRLRIIHNSAHFVDGHFDNSTNQWKDNLEPIPYTKDFGELTFAKNITLKSYLIRTYFSTAYSTLVRPQNLKRFFYNFGIEIAKKSSTKILGQDFNLFASFHSNIVGTPTYTLSNNFKIGCKFGEWNGRGLLIFVQYYNGNNMFSEYYFERINRFGIGFNVEFL